MIDIVGVHEGLNPAESTIAWHQHYMWPPTPYRCPSDRSIEQEELHDEMTSRSGNSKDGMQFHYEVRHSKTIASQGLMYGHYSEE